MTTLYTPLFIFDGNAFFIPDTRYCSDNMLTAYGLGVATEQVAGFEFTRKCGVVERDTPHVRAEIAGIEVCIISGPLFDNPPS